MNENMEITYERDESESERYITQLLRINQILLSGLMIIAINVYNIHAYGFSSAIVIGLYILIFLTVLGYLNSAFGFAPHEILEDKIKSYQNRKL